MSRRPAAGLGRGLSALLDDARAPDMGGARTIAVADIVPNEDQPRRSFDAHALRELADSIAARGVLQPILVRPVDGGKYEIVAGERRWRAAQMAQLHELPALVRDMEPGAALEVAIVENVQRADLTALEEGASYQRLVDEFGHTQEEVGRLVGKSRSHVANLMRILDLPRGVRILIADGKLTMGHAKALLGARDPEKLAEEVVERGLSVRATEAAAARVPPPPRAGGGGAAAGRDADLVALERRVTDALGLKVTIEHGAAGGRVAVGYKSLDQLDEVVRRLSGGRV